MATQRVTKSFLVSGTFTCPDGVTSIDIDCMGAGGGGSVNVGAGGGAAYAGSTGVSVTPGTSYTITVGTSAINTDGGDSSFGSTVIAKGGLSGTNGGTGGTAAASTGTTKRDGANGNIGAGAQQGGGGSSRSSAASGINGGRDSGGNGASTTASSVGKVDGGGGGSQTASATAGGRGRVVLYYDAPVGNSFPYIKSRLIGRRAATNSHVLTLSDNIVAGNLLIVVFSTTDNPTFTGPAGWTELITTQDSTPDVKSVVYYKVAAGGDSATIGLSTSEQASYASYCIDNYTGVPEATAANNTSGSPDCPSLTPTTGYGNYLWIAAGVIDWAVISIVINNTVPAGFQNFDYACGITGGTGLLMSERTQMSSSINPGAYSTGSDAWNAFTISVEGTGNSSGFLGMM